MTIASSDLVYVFSGGTSNFDPNLSLGGDPSSVAIGDISNNLFDLLDANQLQEGIVDYRCFYIFNQNEFDTFWLPKLYTINNSECACQLGVNLVNELQKVLISGTPISGNMIFDFDGNVLTVPFSANPITLKNNFESAFSAAGYVGLVAEVTALSCAFEILLSFEKEDGYKYQPLLEITTNNLTPFSEIFITRINAGSPINTIAQKTPDKVSAPENINFYTYSDGNPLELYALKPLEGFPVWVQRVVLSGTKNSLDQQQTIIFRGKSCLPTV